MSAPPLDDLAGDWMPAADLAHLPSLRNQWGQAHVNADLTSVSWLAMPPFSGGYHTGVLRVAGRVVAADRFRWAPWGVARSGTAAGLTVETDTRLGYERHAVLWRVRLHNPGERPVTVDVEQRLLAPIAHSETGWGWLYGAPWSAGHYPDHFATERVRAEVLADAPRQVQLHAAEPRHLRLGRPRPPGIQRDEDTEPMLLSTELPDHTAPDSGRVRPPAVLGSVRGLAAAPGTFRIRAVDEEHRLPAVALGPGATLSLQFRPDADGQSGVILTHGNHPDSVQLGLTDGRPWLRAGGELVTGGEALAAGRWHGLSVHIGDHGASLDAGGAVLTTEPWDGAHRWRPEIEDTAVVVADGGSPAFAAYAFATPPDRLDPLGGGAVAGWTVTVAPGGTAELGVVLTFATGRSDALRAARHTAGRFAAEHAAVADRWRATWASAFTPGNAVFSGHLPVLDGAPEGLARTYHLGVLLAVYLRNTGVSPIGPVYLTGGPRLGATTTFFWDQSEWPHTAARLDPVALRAWLLAALAQPYERCHSFDTRNLLPTGNHYAANDYALFRTVRAYLAETGDLALLPEKAGAATVLDHLRAMAYRPRSARARWGDGVLMDFGRDPWELLECVPNYRDAVVSLNAAHAGMLRSLAGLLRRLPTEDETAAELSAELSVEAARADADADALTAAVLGQYAGGGRWRIAHPEGDETIGHVLDFALVAAELADDLPEHVRAEMVEFAATHLVDGDWMRALAPDDPVAPRSDRPDHGAAGAFGAWPGATAHGLCRLGRPDLAEALLSRIHAATSGGLWGQAMEAVGGGRFRVAERGVANRDSNAGVAATEAILLGPFGPDVHRGDRRPARTSPGNNRSSIPPMRERT
ncbi:hypothetical protein GCM10009827_068100 [Dactylosporangium maewongense]|uniref:Uncharacterized protein n=1 Tax=Dactylosporangium maewongense TaxID=634393 RepID=A0ABP4M849_9ACTN